ncbi:hypothetical protein P8452_43462 [Trifolium repens]|nr:hypothetical protein P8452_43462 [Trifolium repens]
MQRLADDQKITALSSLTLIPFVNPPSLTVTPQFHRVRILSSAQSQAQVQVQSTPFNLFPLIKNFCSFLLYISMMRVVELM